MFRSRNWSLSWKKRMGKFKKLLSRLSFLNRKIKESIENLSGGKNDINGPKNKEMFREERSRRKKVPSSLNFNSTNCSTIKAAF